MTDDMNNDLAEFADEGMDSDFDQSYTDDDHETKDYATDEGNDVTDIIDDVDNNEFDSDNFDDDFKSDAETDKSKDGSEEEYGKRVQKRINKEISKRKALEDQNRELQERLNRVEKRFEEQDAQQEMRSIDSKLKDLAQKRKDMYDMGDIDPDIEDQYQDLRFEKKQLEARNKAPDRQQDGYVPNRASEQQVRFNGAQQEWLDDNDWYTGANGTDPSTVRANQIYINMIQSEGFSPEHPGTYKELTRRMSAQPKPRGNRPPPTVAPTGSSPGNPSVRGKAKLTRDDFNAMEEMGMNPNNPLHRKEWLSNKKG